MVLKQRLALFAAALWWGSLCAIGFLVVPMLFANLPTPAMAGALAGKLFAAQVWVAVACGLLVLMVLRAQAAQPDGGPDRIDAAAQLTLGLVAAGLACALLQEFVVAPRILARDNLRVWHTTGTALYAAQWVFATCVFWRLAGAWALTRASAAPPTVRDE